MTREALGQICNTREYTHQSSIEDARETTDLLQNHQTESSQAALPAHTNMIWSTTPDSSDKPRISVVAIDEVANAAIHWPSPSPQHKEVASVIQRSTEVMITLLDLFFHHLLWNRAECTWLSISSAGNIPAHNWCKFGALRALLAKPT